MAQTGTWYNNYNNMAFNPTNINGQATSANSSPVVIASDQSAVPVSGTITANIGTVATLATATKQDTGNTSIASIDTKTPVLGQALATASVPVVLTAAQITTLTPLTAVQANAGTNLNTSALNLEATQSAMSAKLPATLGQKAMVASMAVVLASDQSAVPVTLASTTITGVVTVAGNKTNNNAAPGATNIGILPAIATASAPTHTEGNQVGLSVDNSGALRTSASAATASDTNTTGSLVAVGSVTSPTLNGAETTSIQITGTWVATVTFEASINGTDFFAINSLPVNGSTVVQTTTANGQWQSECGAFALVRARVSAYTSGTVAITVRTSIGGGLVDINATTASIQATTPVGTENGVVVRNIPIGDQFITGQGAQTAAGQNIILATAGTTSTDTVNGISTASYRSVYFQVVPTGTVSSGVVTFEGSNDNTNFISLQFIDTSGQATLPISNYTAATGVTRYLEGKTRYRYIRARISTVIGGGGSLQCFSRFSTEDYSSPHVGVQNTTAANLNATVSGTVTSNLGTGGTAATSLGKAEDAVAASGDTGVAILALRNDALTSNVSVTGKYIVPVTDLYGAQIIKDQQRHKRTYSCAFVVAPVALATDIFQIIGSASTTVEINRITISGTQTTGGMVDVYIAKRSTANTVGTFTASTNVPHISTDAAATAVGSIYTANPTLGALVGNVHIMSMTFGTVATTSLNIREVNFGERGKPIVLSGVAQALAVSLNGVTVTGGSIKITVEITEY